MERRLDDWLTSYLEYTENSESPISYHTWAGVSCIAGSLQRKVYMRLGHSTLYPNNYIVLVGPSANARKGEPLVIARDIIDELNIYTIGEDSTPEALIRDIKGSELTYQDPSTGDWKWHSSVTGFIEELAVFTGHQNTSFLAYLTNWYDSRDKWTRRTKHQGVDEIIGMCFNFLASTAPDWLPHILTKEAIGGGFTSRCIFVVEDRKRKTVLDPNANMPSPKLREDLIHDLEIINTIVGQYDWDKQAKQEYEDWYAEHDRRVTGGESLLGDPILDGYVGRRPSHIRKISMVCAASHSDELVITSEDFQCSNSFSSGRLLPLPPFKEALLWGSAPQTFSLHKSAFLVRSGAVRRLLSKLLLRPYGRTTNTGTTKIRSGGEMRPRQRGATR